MKNLNNYQPHKQYQSINYRTLNVSSSPVNINSTYSSKRGTCKDSIKFQQNKTPYCNNRNVIGYQNLVIRCKKTSNLLIIKNSPRSHQTRQVYRLGKLKVGMNKTQAMRSAWTMNSILIGLFRSVKVKESLDAAQGLLDLNTLTLMKANHPKLPKMLGILKRDVANISHLL